MTAERPDDGDLRRRFDALRDEEARAAPQFGLPAARPVRLRLAPAGLAAAAIVVVAAGVWLAVRPSESDWGAPGLDLGTTGWVSPTDFLLETPGLDLLRTIPAVLAPDSLPGLDLPTDQLDTPNPEDLS